jgi:hypothetical protein
VTLGQDQVDLGAVAVQPPDRVAESLGRFDLVEAEERPELDRSVHLLGRDLDGDVLKHGPRIWRVGSGS